MRLRRHAGALAVAVVLLPTGTASGTESSETARCVRAAARRAAAVARAQARINAACAAALAGPRPVDLPVCLRDDPRRRRTAAEARTRADVVRFCSVTPPFGVPQRMADTLVAAATVHERGLVEDLLGLDLPAASLADRRTARCPRTALRGTATLAATYRLEAHRCQHRVLASNGDAAAFAACALGPTPAVARARSRLERNLKRACRRGPLPFLLPGRCAIASRPTLAACLAARAACRACRFLDSTAALGLDCDVLDDGIGGNGSCRFGVPLSGNALDFLSGARIAGATVSLVERPEARTVTGSAGEFAFADLAEGDLATLVLDHPDYVPIQTASIRLGPEGASRVTFQAVTPFVYDAFADLLAVTPDPARCQLVTTITRVGKSIYDPGAHGEAGATVTLSPPVAAAQGPIYFNASVLPDRALVESSEDGGVLFVNVPPGVYRWSAFKPGAAFSWLTMTCRPGLLVNASPPWGLQRQAE